MKEKIITEMKEYLSVDLYAAMDDWYDLDALAHKLDKLFREELETELELAAERDRWVA